MLRKAVSTFCFACLGFSGFSAAQEPYQLTVPGRGWAVNMNLPPLGQFQGQEKEGVFQFMGRGSKETMVVSLFVEPSQLQSSQGCRKEYWGKGSRNPMIVRESVSLVEVGGHPGATYIIEAAHEGQKVRTQNVNVYLHHSGTCIDVHLSSFPLAEGDESRLVALAATVGVVSLPRRRCGAQPITGADAKAALLSSKDVRRR